MVILIRRSVFLIIAVAVCLLINGCANNANESETINWSAPKHSDVTDKDYEETQGYTAAFFSVEELAVDKIKEWIDSCDLNGRYYQYINADPDSWEMYIYYPCETNNNYNTFKFYIADSCVNVNVESGDISAGERDYVLLLIQAPSRGAWPSSSRLFIDNIEIELSSIEFAT